MRRGLNSVMRFVWAVAAASAKLPTHALDAQRNAGVDGTHHDLQRHAVQRFHTRPALAVCVEAGYLVRQAREVRDGVRSTFGITLVNEPVIVGGEL